MDDKHLLNLAKEISEIINRNRVYNANIITELHANENAHSRILRMFLQYDDSKKEYPILRKFLEIPKVKKIFGNKGFKNPVFSNEQERIDVLIEEPGSFAVIVENKIKGATDQERQLERYIKSVNGHGVPYDNIYAIYLTDSGDKEVSDVSFTDVAKECLGYKDENDMGRFVPMNYRYDILPWLEKEVLPNCSYKEDLLLSALKQYIDYLKCMFGIIENEEQKILIMEKLKKDLGIKGCDVEAVGVCFTAIEQLENLKNRIGGISVEIIKKLAEEYIKIPFERYLQEKPSVYTLEDVVFSNTEFNISVYSPEWEKIYFRVQYMDGRICYGIYNKDTNNPFMVENCFEGFNLNNKYWPAWKWVRWDFQDPNEFGFWKQVLRKDSLQYLKQIFEEVEDNISK